MNIGWPEGIYLTLTILGLGMALANDGQPRNGNHSFFATFIATALVMILLYWGGFFA